MQKDAREKAIAFVDTIQGAHMLFNDMDSAPKDKPVRLFVKYTAHPLDDAELEVTLGIYTEDFGWTFAGWDEAEGQFTNGKGEVLGWLPLIEVSKAG